MRFSLTGELQYGCGHDSSKTKLIIEFFDAENIETAIMIAKAMVQSHKLVEEKCHNDVEKLSAILKNDEEREVWRTNLVPEKRQMQSVVIAPEHFEEEISSPS